MKKNLFMVFVMASVLILNGCRNNDKKNQEPKILPEVQTETVVVEEKKEVPVAEVQTNPVIVPQTVEIKEKDSDGDKIPDKVDAEPKRALKETLLAKGFQNLIILDNIKLGTDELSPSMLKLLDIVNEILQSDSSIKIKVIGHTCDLGTDAFNMDLSKRRAQAAENYLLGKNTSRAQISVEWKGESQPMVANSSEKNRSKNRRVQILFYQDANEIK